MQHAHQLAQQSPQGAKQAEGEDGEADDAMAEIPAESAADFMHRMDQFVNVAIAMARQQGRGNDEYKDGLVYEERKRVLAEFVKAAQGWKKCTRCNA